MKGKGMSIAVLLGKGKPKDESADSEDEAMDSESSGEVSPGLVEAMSELRAALSSEDDEAAATAFKNAMDCC